MFITQEPIADERIMDQRLQDDAEVTASAQVQKTFLACVPNGWWHERHHISDSS
jgi:hypothetical protein